MQPASHLRRPLKSRQIVARGWLVEPEGDLRRLPSEKGEGRVGVGGVGLNLILRDGEKFSPAEAVAIGTSDWESDSVNRVRSDSGGNTRG